MRRNTSSVQSSARNPPPRWVQPLAVAAAFAAMLAVASALSTPRRVGDGGEYLVMAHRLAALHSPALTRAEIADSKAALRALGAGFDSSLLDYPALVGSDARQGFLHFWLYPLLAVPGVWTAQLLRLHPNWAFTFTNIALLAAAVFVVARAAPAIAVVYGFAGPIIWWVDKAHPEAFLFAALAVAAVCVERFPSVAMLSLALAGAQNAAIGLVYPVFVCLVLGASWHTRRWTRRDVCAAVAGCGIIAMPLAYNWIRLGKLAPMVEYAHVTVPSAPALLGFVGEPNIGILVNAPVYLLAVVGLAGAIRTGAMSPWNWCWPAVMQLLLLLVWSQNPNANHGGTPGLNRWVLSLLPLSLPWFIGGYVSAPFMLRRALVTLTVALAAYSVYWHLPNRPERYLYPTAVSRTLWQQGWLRLTSAEVFAERTAHAESPAVPVADDRCDVVLAWDMQWPVTCVPPGVEFPAACMGVEAFCLAAQQDSGVHAVPVYYNGFFFRPRPVSWPAAGPLARSVRRVLLSLDPAARRWELADHRQWVRTQVSVAAPVFLERDSRLFIYIARTGRAPALILHAGHDAVASVYTLIPLQELSTASAADGALTLAMPPDAENLAVTVTSAVVRGDRRR